MKEAEGEVVAKSYAQAKKLAVVNLRRNYPTHRVVFVSVEQRDGLRLHSSPSCCYKYYAMLKSKEK